MAFAPNSILFEALRNILTEKSEALFKKHTENEYLWKTFSKFMVMRYLTMSSNANVRDVVLDNILQLDRMPPKELYRWLLKNVPQQRSSFIKYLK